MTAPAPPDTSWFQTVVTAVLGILGLLWGWAQFQIAWLRRDNEKTEDRAVAAVEALRQEFNQRHSEHVATQNRQHDDNRAEQAANRATLQANAAVAAADARRMLDRLDGIVVRLGEIADRDEVTRMISAIKP